MTASIPIKDTGTINQIKALYIAKGKDIDLLMFLLTITTGINLKNLLELNVGDVKGRQYFSPDSRKSVLLKDEVQELIKKIIKGRNNNEPLFVGLRGHRLDRNTVFRRFKEICGELALDERINVASWRKTFGYHYYQKYRDLSYLLWFFNQTSVEAAMQYIGVNENMNLRYRDGIDI